MIQEKRKRFISPIPEVTDRHWEALKWQWEFMRRSKGYQERYKEMKRKLGDTIGIMANPTISFDHLYRQVRKSYQTQQKHLSPDQEQSVRKEIIQLLGFTVNPWRPRPLRSNTYCISFSVDISQPDQVIKDQVMSLVKEARRAKELGIQGDLPKIKRGLYEKYIKVFDLAKKGLKNEEIAENVFSEEWEKSLDADRIHEKSIDQDSILVKVSRYKKEAKAMVNGGYTEII